MRASQIQMVHPEPPGVIKILGRDLVKNKWKYLMFLPVLIFYIIFFYVPMYGAIIAFKDFSPSLGIMDSPWVGFQHFTDFFTNYYFYRILKNTFVISVAGLIFGFPVPILFALLINEVKSKRYAKLIQSVSYLPHFISLVVVCGMIKEFTMDTGFINDIIAFFGGPRVSMLNNASYFVPVYIVSNIWQEAGWCSIIYIAALSGVDGQLYEAAVIDGAGRIRQTLAITLPSILPTIMIMLVLQVGNILNVGFEKIILLYNPSTYETADTISTYVYRQGLREMNWSYSTAVGLFNSIVNFIFLMAANYFSKKTTDVGLW